MYNKVGGSEGILPRENLKFRNLRYAIFGLLALMFALLQMLSLPNLKVFFWWPPLYTVYFLAWPPLKSHQPTPPHTHLIKNERSLRNHKKCRILISKRTLLLKTEYPWRRWPENHYVCRRAGGRVGFPAKHFPKERVFSLFQVNRIPFILFILLSRAQWTEWYSVHSENGIAPQRTQIPSIEYFYSGIVPKERALSWVVE